jgi:hypothetical protein
VIVALVYKDRRGEHVRHVRLLSMETIENLISIMDEQALPEHHEGTLNLTGEGNS